LVVLLKLILQTWALTIANERNKGLPVMNSGFIKSILLSFAIAAGLLLVVNIIGELAIQPQMVLPALKVEQPESVKPVTTEPKAQAVTAYMLTPANGISSLLAAYDPEAGKQAFRKCKACHTSKKGDKNRVGPNLWNVVGREKGGVEGFKYSDAIKLKGGTWTFAELNAFLISPRAFISGTRMSIKGYKDPLQRATLIGYLRSLSDKPKAIED
jgi:cytochrome c